MKSVLVCFTASFPYGTKETYFYNEIMSIASAFDQIYIVPTYNPYGKMKRDTPKNVIVCEPLVEQGIRRVFAGLFNFSPINVYFSDFFKQKVYLSLKRIKKWFNSFLVFRITYKKFASLESAFGADAILYSYWAEAPLFFTERCNKYLKVVRMHGGDFYLDRNDDYLPVREYIYSFSDLILPISNDIKLILESRYRIEPRKIYISYLGTNNYSKSSAIINDEKIRIVSCSNVYDLKRIPLILEVIKQFKNNIKNVKIEWHHFGDGEGMTELRRMANKIENHEESIFFHGSVSQLELFNFYSNNFVHWFINTSRFEGVPVSIMEAFSFGIPAIATDVGATREIVNKSNGFLIPLDFDLVDVIEQILTVVKKDEYFRKRNKAYETWYSKFNASTNYKNLVEVLKRSHYSKKENI